MILIQTNMCGRGGMCHARILMYSGSRNAATTGSTAGSIAGSRNASTAGSTAGSASPDRVPHLPPSSCQLPPSRPPFALAPPSPRPVCRMTEANCQLLTAPQHLHSAPASPPPVCPTTDGQQHPGHGFRHGGCVHPAARPLHALRPGPTSQWVDCRLRRTVWGGHCVHRCSERVCCAQVRCWGGSGAGGAFVVVGL